MRIITGRYKGRVLSTLHDRSVRPATDRVKGAIFNVLQNRLALGGAHVLDLFAGSGSLGFEALSRGAERAVFVDESRSVLDVVEENATKLGCLASCEIIEDDALIFIQRTTEQFDLVFADPPYADERTSQVPDLLFPRQLLKRGGFVIIEHDKKTIFSHSPHYTLALQKEFGNTRVSFLCYPLQGPEENKG